MTGAAADSGTTTAGHAVERRLHHPRLLLELKYRSAHRLRGFCRRHHTGQRVAQSANRACVQLRYPRLVDANFGADLFHRGFLVVIQPDDFLFARRQRLDGGANALLDFRFLVGGVWLFGLRRNERRRQRRLVEVFAAGEWGCRFDGIDADDRAPQALFVGSHLGGEIGQRGFAPKLAAKLLARRFQFTPLPTNASRPCVLAERVDHRAADATLGEGLELDAARFVEAVRRVDQANHTVLHQVPNINRVGHRRSHPASELLDERKIGNDAGILFALTLTRAHEHDLRRPA
jgi:hypothetical protein